MRHISHLGNDALPTHRLIYKFEQVFRLLPSNCRELAACGDFLADALKSAAIIESQPSNRHRQAQRLSGLPVACRFDESARPHTTWSLKSASNYDLSIQPRILHPGWTISG